MTVTNHERVGRALELLRSGLIPFFEREMQAKYGEAWLDLDSAKGQDCDRGTVEPGVGGLCATSAVAVLVTEPGWDGGPKRSPPHSSSHPKTHPAAMGVIAPLAV